MRDGKPFCLRRNTVNMHGAEVVNSVNRENAKEYCDERSMDAPVDG